MKLIIKIPGILILFIGVFLSDSCRTDNNTNINVLGRKPVIEPDYSGVTIPLNIAPMNFVIKEDGVLFTIRAKSSKSSELKMKSSDGAVHFPMKSWKKLLAESQGGRLELDIFSEDNEGKVKKFSPIYMNVANEAIDPYLCYRLLYPGYESWGEMKIVQRSTEDFKESSLIENQLLKDNCVNCHSFIQNNPDKFLIHVRGSMGGTYFVDGEEITRKELRTQNMPGNAVYPSWHPSGRYVAFSSNTILQSIHMHPDKNVEFIDLVSVLVIYNIEKNEISAIPEYDTAKYMETLPFWSPDGNFLYYCRTKQVKEVFDYRNVHFDLVRKSFNQISGEFGNTEIVFNALKIDKSASFPSISPDDQYLVFTLLDYGTSSIWHKEADLYLLNLKNGKVDRMDLNSDETESYHSWSSNGRWLVFSSKRGDGLTARPFIAYFNSPDNIGKPFVLPQKDPTLYKRMSTTFNKPEFVTGRINIGPRDFARASNKDPMKTIWTGTDYSQKH